MHSIICIVDTTGVCDVCKHTIFCAKVRHKTPLLCCSCQKSTHLKHSKTLQVCQCVRILCHQSLGKGTVAQTRCCVSSVVERVLGKDEAASSILAHSTITPSTKMRVSIMCHAHLEDLSCPQGVTAQDDCNA
jgi:hypothetical protein